MLVECDRAIEDCDNIITLFVNQKLVKDPEFVIPFKEDIKYYLYPSRNEIYVHTENKEYLYSSFFNVPMSVYALLKGTVLLHCNAIEYNNVLYCFSGNKGIGKTTLSMFLKKYGTVFSDDCIAVNIENDNKIYGYRATQTLKLTRKTYELTVGNEGYNDTYDKISQKTILSFFKNQYNRIPIRKIVFLVRGIENKFIMNKINSTVEKKVLLIQSVVGKDYIPKNIVGFFGKTQLFNKIIEEIPFFITQIPTLNEYRDSIQDLFNKLIE